MKPLFHRSKNTIYLLFAFASLVVGITSTIVISKYLLWEYQTDNNFTEKDNIYLITGQESAMDRFRETEIYGGISDLPGMKYTSTRFYWEAKLEYEGIQYQGVCLVADSSFFEFFDYPLLFGNPKTILKDPEDIILSSEFANKLFGNKDPFGMQLTVHSEDNINTYKVAGVLDRPPGNTSLEFDYIIPYHSGRHYWSRMGAGWVLLNPDADISNAEKILAEKRNSRNQDYRIKLSPFRDFYFEYSGDLIRASHGDRAHLKLLLIIMISVFGLSMFNFFASFSLVLINRKKELGMRKVIGAGTSEYLKIFVRENLLLCFLAFVFSILIIVLIYPYFIDITGKALRFPFIKDGIILLIFFVFVLLLTITSSLFTAGRISALHAMIEPTENKKKLSFLRMIVVLQYSITITLLILSFSFHRQLKFMLTKDLQFNCENVVSIDFIDEIPFQTFTQEEYREKTEELNRNLDVLKNELASSPLVIDYCFGSSPLDGYSMGWKKKGADDYRDGALFSCTPGYEKVFQFHLLEGRFLNKEMDSDRQNKVVINEAAARFYGIKDISTEKLCNYHWGKEDDPFTIIGIVKDFNNEHLSRPVSPAIFMYFENPGDEWYIRFQEGMQQETIGLLKSLHSMLSPGEEFRYRYMGDELSAIYINDRMQVKLYSVLTLLAIFVSVMGILSLSLHYGFRRTRETAIRKVNGCSIRRAGYEMLLPIMKLTLVAFLIACFSGWYFATEYLKNFTYKLPLSYMNFILSGGIAILLTLVILSITVRRIAGRNPVEAIYRE